MRNKFIVFYLLILSFIYSCNNGKHEKLIVYYFNNDFDSVVALECNEMLNQIDVVKVEIDDPEIIKLIKSNLKGRKSDILEVDTRYKIIFEKDTLCVDRFGNFVNDYEVGKIENFDLFKDFIKNFKGKKEEVTESLQDFTKIEEE